MIVDRVVLDTDVASRLMRASLPGDLTASLAAVAKSMTFVTVGELLRGAVHAQWGARRLRGLADWIDRAPIIVGDVEVARRWGEITGRALASGRPLPPNDAWIAACCLTHGVPLATLNRRDFEQVEGLRFL